MSDKRSGAVKRDADHQWIEFLLGETRCAIPILVAQEILKPPDIVRIPGLPAHVEGILSLRGKIIPVVDLAIRFGASPAAASPTSRIIVAAANGRLVGFRVQHVTRILRLEADSIDEIPDHAAPGGTEPIQRVARTPEGLVLLWDMGRVLSLEDLDRLAKIPVDPGKSP